MLTPLELDIMKAVWRKPPITVREVQQAIFPLRKLAYTSVMTIMDRLYHKGFLTRALRARTHYYEPAVGYTQVRDEAVEMLFKSFLACEGRGLPHLRRAADHNHKLSQWVHARSDRRYLSKQKLLVNLGHFSCHTHFPIAKHVLYIFQRRGNAVRCFVQHQRARTVGDVC